MRKTILTRMFWLGVLATLLASCGTMASPPTSTQSPTQPPTSTSVPPTETPIPTDTPTPLPTDTATAAPTQSLHSIIDALLPVASGSGVAETTAYDPNRNGNHPIIIISSKDQDGWNKNLPTFWRPLYVNQVELVATLNYHQTQFEVQRFLGAASSTNRGGFIRSYRVDTEVILREAQTGKLVAQATFLGGNPPPIPKQLPAGTQATYGSLTDYQTVQLWLKEYVER